MVFFNPAIVLFAVLSIYASVQLESVTRRNHDVVPASWMRGGLHHSTSPIRCTPFSGTIA